MNEAQLKRACLLCVQEALRACEPQAKKLGHSALQPLKTQVVDSGDDFVHARVVWDRPAYMSFPELSDILDSLVVEGVTAIRRKSGAKLMNGPSRTTGWMPAFSNKCTLELQVSGAAMDFVMLAENIED